MQKNLYEMYLKLLFRLVKIYLLAELVLPKSFKKNLQIIVFRDKTILN